MKLNHCLTPYIKINSKSSKDLNFLTPEIIKLKTRRRHSKHLDIGFGSDFLNLTPKATKAKINKWDYTILKSF